MKSRRDKKALRKIYSRGAAFEVRDFAMANPEKIGETVTLWVQSSSDIDLLMKGGIDRNHPRRIGGLKTIRSSGSID